ncbi:MAG TPA: copper chaperone PCu(A)C [Vitreimonas sp.]|jgi:copper(I)-binding protein|nr:copper chaperone PCu(A)C [Vitreimonas sp.]
MRTLFAVALLSCLAACGQPHAQNDQQPATGIRTENATLHIEDAWAPPTPGGVDVAAGYLTIVNGSSTDDQLVSAESPRAEHVEVHEMIMNGAVMQMRPMSALPVAAHDQATLSPGGRHLMFTGVKQPFTPGEQIPVDLTFAHAGKIHVTLDVRAPS